MKKRVLALLITVVLVGGMYYKMPIVFLAPAQTAAIDAAVSSAYSSVVQNLNLSARDPFAVPSDFVTAPKTTEATGSGRTGATYSSNSSLNSSQRDPRPQLTGVVVAASGGSAIIQYGANSQSYQRGDYVGSYRVAAIGQESVTLQGPGGPITLRMER